VKEKDKEHHIKTENEDEIDFVVSEKLYGEIWHY